MTEIATNNVDNLMSDDGPNTKTVTNIDSTVGAGETSDDQLEENVRKQSKTDQSLPSSLSTSLSTSSTNAPPNEPLFRFAPYVPILKPDDRFIIDPSGIVDYFKDTSSSALSKRLIGEILPDDAIVEAPSLVTPLLLKKKTKWPLKEANETKGSTLTKDKTGDECQDKSQSSPDNSDDIQVIKAVEGSQNSTNVSLEASPPNSNSNHKDVETYVKSTTVASLINAKVNNNKSILTIQDYYKTSAGELLLGIGLSRVREFVLEDNAKRLTSKIRKGDSSLIPNLDSLQTELAEAKRGNSAYKSQALHKCPVCYFKSEFSVVLEGHLEAPHMNNKREYLCNWCDHKSKDSGQITFHNLMFHKKRCRIEKPLSNHCCRFCPFECKSKRKMSAHAAKCELSYREDKNLEPQGHDENDFPAITSKFITQEDVKTYEETLKNIRLAAYNPHQIKVSGSVNQGSPGQPILVVPRPISVTTYSHPNQTNFSHTIPVSSAISPFTAQVAYIRSNMQPPRDPQQNLQTSPHLLHLISSQNSNSSQNKATIVKHPKSQSPFSNGRSVIRNASEIIMPPQNQSPMNGINVQHSNLNKPSSDGNESLALSSPNPKGSTFVICEICDGYIKDLSQLKSHMQWTHKVKIHQKTLESRPPLNCQKCQWRFFTDQGLERHLLGAHALVTSNMQELVDQGMDSGRCTVCGRAANTLVSHMKEVHKANLKPAHLSYKCTVCEATFNLYRLFENHVYSVHSESVKRISSN